MSDGRGLTRSTRVAPISLSERARHAGLTAYVGLLDIGRLKAGETVFVSAASVRSARWPLRSPNSRAVA